MRKRRGEDENEGGSSDASRGWNNYVKVATAQQRRPLRGFTTASEAGVELRFTSMKGGNFAQTGDMQRKLTCRQIDEYLSSLVHGRQRLISE